MKRKIFISMMIFPVIFIFLNCSVGDVSGLVRITNRTGVELKNVRIGSIIISGSVSSGNYMDYWFAWEISGKLSSENMEVRSTQKNLTFTLKPGYWVDITASKISDRQELYIQASKIGGTLPPSDWIK